MPVDIYHLSVFGNNRLSHEWVEVPVETGAHHIELCWRLMVAAKAALSWSGIGRVNGLIGGAKIRVEVLNLCRPSWEGLRRPFDAAACRPTNLGVARGGGAADASNRIDCRKGC